MSAPDPRLGEIEARLAADVAAYNDHGFIGGNQCMTDRAYLLTELRKRDEVIARVEAVLTDRDHSDHCDLYYAWRKDGCTCWQWDIRAAVTAAKGDGES